MQSPGWVTLVTELTQHGYVELLFLEIFCPRDGDWRGAIARLSGITPACPKCLQPAKIAILGKGLTRNPEIEWTCISPPLPDRLKRFRDLDITPKSTPS